VQITVIKIIDESFPIWLNFEIVDLLGNVHTFTEKAPVIFGNTESIPNSFPQLATIECKVIEISSSFAIIDTSQPHGICSLKGESHFKINADVLFES